MHPSLLSGLEFNRWRVSLNLQMVVLSSYFLLAVTLCNKSYLLFPICVFDISSMIAFKILQMVLIIAAFCLFLPDQVFLLELWLETIDKIYFEKVELLTLAGEKCIEHRGLCVKNLFLNLYKDEQFSHLF